PEQCQGKALDRRSDLFSMGVVLWEALTGMRLFARDSELLTFKAICDEPTPPLQGEAANVESLRAICAKALSKHKRDRFPAATDMRSALLQVVRASELSQSPERALAALME